MKALGLHHRPTFFYNYMQPVMTTGLVEMTQPESPRSPNQKYRLTEKGEMVIFQSDPLGIRHRQCLFGGLAETLRIILNRASKPL